MKNYLASFILIFTCINSYAQLSKEIQLKTAVLAAPEEKREGAKIYGFDANGDLVVIRQGSNDMVCLADNPSAPEINIACYHKDLEPFMARGRELKKEGKSFREIFDQREAEVKAGKLKMPENPTTLFVLSAKDEDLNETTGELTNSYLRYVVYIPYATSETTGLPLAPTAPGMPWIMDPGTHRAHIMISPPANK